MPSGPKKRKAAKKKKEKEANINPSIDTQGNEDLKSQDEKGSDSGDLSTPTFQDHHNHSNPFNGGKEESKERDPPLERPFVAGTSIKEAPSNTGATEKTGSQDDVIKVNKDLKSKDDSQSKHVSNSIDNLGSPIGRRDRDDRHSQSSSSSGSSSSEDEAQIIKKKSDENSSVSKTNLSDDTPGNMSRGEAICVTENATIKETVNLFGETSKDVNSVKPEVSVSEETIFAAESSVVSDVPVSGFKEGKEKLLHMVEESTFASVALTDSGLKEIEDKVPSGDQVHASSNVVLPQSETDEGKISESSGVSVAETRNGAEHVGASETPEYLENRPLVTPGPLVVQRTSVFSCCGLFDVFSGSNK